MPLTYEPCMFSIYIQDICVKSLYALIILLSIKITPGDSRVAVMETYIPSTDETISGTFNNKENLMKIVQVYSIVEILIKRCFVSSRKIPLSVNL